MENKIESLQLSSHISQTLTTEESFNLKTPIQLILSKFCENSKSDYIFHTRIFLEYDDEDAFIFVFKSQLVFTHFFDETEQELKSNPILFIIKFQQVYFYDLQVNESEGNHIVLQFFENDLIKKSEIKLKFTFLKDSYLIHHFIKKYFIQFWQKTFEQNVLNSSDLNNLVYNYHFLVKKLNRWGKNQDRILLITDRFIFNLKQSIKNEKVSKEITNKENEYKNRWADSIKSITKVAVIINKSNELRIYYEKKINEDEFKLNNVNKKLLKYKKSRDFIFLNNFDRNYFLFLIRQNYFKISGKYVQIEEIKIA